MTVVFVFGVALLGACGGGGCGTVVAEVLDVRGASNAACSLTINKGNNITFDISAPSPTISDASLSPPRNPPHGVGLGDICAGGVSASVTPNIAGAIRTSDNICFFSHGTTALDDALGTGDCTGVTITLVCAGTTLYDHVQINACSCQG